MSLKIRLALLTAGLLVAGVSLFSAALLWSERRALEHAQTRRRVEALNGLVDVCRGAVVGEQDLLLTNYLKRLGGLKEVLEASCADESGRVLGHTDMSLVQSVLPPGEAPPQAGFRRDGDRILGSAPVTVGTRTRGAVRLTLDGRGLDAEMESALAEARGRILKISGAVIALGFAAAFLITRWALASLGTLVAGVRTIAGGKLDHRISAEGAAEIALLSREFNAMAGRLDELDRMKADFVNSVTHDLKSPITAVKSALDALQSPKASAEDAAANRLAIRENADRLMNLVTSILEVARIENGMVLDKRPVQLEEVADRVARTFRPLAAPKGLEVETLVIQELAPVSADSSKLERLLANLVGNAVKFTEKGRVTVELDAEPGFQIARVKDTGPGIPPEALGRLFTKFFRVRRPGEKVEGTGLGLAIAKGIAEAHGGSLSVESTVGQGTTFTLRLP